MKPKASLEHIRDLLLPGISGINDKYGRCHTVVVDHANERLMLTDGRVFVDNKTCRDGDDQMKQLNVLHKRLYHGGK